MNDNVDEKSDQIQPFSDHETIAGITLDTMDGAYRGDDESEYVEDAGIPVIVKCPSCSLIFNGTREKVEEGLFDHIWSRHSESAIVQIVNNMYIPDDLKMVIFERMGMDYISWIVDTDGEIE